MVRGLRLHTAFVRPRVQFLAPLLDGSSELVTPALGDLTSQAALGSCIHVLLLRIHIYHR